MPVFKKVMQTLTKITQLTVPCIADFLKETDLYTILSLGFLSLIHGWMACCLFSEMFSSLV